MFEDTLTAILYLSPYTSGGFGNVCPKATEGCIQSCLNTAGRGAFSNVQKARQRKTELFFKDNAEFKRQLHYDLSLFLLYCKENNMKGFVRLNGTSDIDWSKIKLNDSPNNIYSDFPELMFYDYTKDWSRTSQQENYYLTYSYTENTILEAVSEKLNNNNNVAVVFDEIPSSFLSFEVINGDESDLRVYDERGKILGLKAKGKAKKDTSGFVIKTLNI